FPFILICFCLHYLFPTRRSSDLTPATEISYTVAVPTNVKALTQTATADDNGQVEFTVHGVESAPHVAYVGDYTTFVTIDGDHQRDRKSTRLNSSHVSISYAVF